MIIISLTIIFILNIKTSSADLWFFNKIKRMVSRQVKDKTLKGTFKTVLYLGSVAKISCFGKKYLLQSFRRLSWFHSGKHLSNNNHFKIDNYGILTINGVTVEDSGEFVCMMRSKSNEHRYKHNVNVIQFPSRSLHVHFVYAVRLCTTKSETFATHFIESKVRGKICPEKECKMGYIHSSCYFEQFANPRIKVTVPVLLPGVPNVSCDTQCLREKQDFLKEEVKQKVIAAVMLGSRLKIREEPREISISYLETEDDNICDPGFEMKGSVKKSLCFPCTPGHFLEKGYCIPCHLNHYNGKYAASECIACFGSRKTRSRGAISEEDCYLADPDLFWILFPIVMIPISFILLCCCWSSLKCLRRSIIGKCIVAMCSFNFLRRKKTFNANNEKDMKLSKDASESPEQSKTLHKRTRGLKQSLGKRSFKKKVPVSESSFVIPSVRHSVGKDILYKPLRPIAQGNIPPPPAMPTDSTMNKATRNIAYHTVESIDKQELKKAEERGRTTADRHAASNMTDISLEDRDDNIPPYRERIKRNKPMYNAYMKSKL